MDLISWLCLILRNIKPVFGDLGSAILEGVAYKSYMIRHACFQILLIRYKMIKPLISVIIPTFNRDGTLPDAVNSVLNQSSVNFEIIVVDDCSDKPAADSLSFH